ncbi:MULTISPECIES: hypothetical protein [unclassified Sphingobium]|uniref:hypothetical protein n=1 Tax=unclassified Sphingobium TaxID=2611147 RepID=UPI000D1670DE|nr:MULTISPECIES: hypothetical protein [unclassified Sphingobium]MBG6119349.1 hypothetical protein [Sphingobium sp. JAI105]PSO10918.1 hypothetical protein C7E20_14360 [Sphingobium sp. AEW4]TWD04821.1 hypothetical protein FB595_111102 [Sphingobium sp. AEW010]TWD22229.1 hypothetical protein FB596_111102 [Sphingobium sp. AEW013]TWD24718.1 hypothetical protein FB594_111102 [Sphingobium sp. AEW001]
MANPLTEGNALNLSEVELDKPIYRIMPEAFVVSLFADRTNVLSQVHNWKDKFENFQLNLGGKLDGKRFEYGFRNDFVGQCWTRENLSEAMWGIYANDPNARFLRIRSTPRKVLASLVAANPSMPQDTCFIGKVKYKRERELQAYAQSGDQLDLSPQRFASHLLLKRRAFKHEGEVRLLYFGDAKDYDGRGLYRYAADPHSMITQIMADPNRDRGGWKADKAALQEATAFTGSIKRSKIYDPPEWGAPDFQC